MFSRCGIDFHQITGVLEDGDPCWKEIDAWVDAARVANVMFHNRLGLMGHYYNGMMDIHSDVTLLLSRIGGHAEIIEVDELSALRAEVDETAIRQKVEEFGRTFEIQDDCDPAELEVAARTSVALDRMVEKHGLNSLAYFYAGTGNPANEETMCSIILGNSLLTARGVPGPIMEIGNTNSRYRFPLGVREFVGAWSSHGPAHHCAVGVGHVADRIRKLGALLEVETIRIC